MNIQENIIGGIVELLYKHDYLVLPGFGGFVLKSQASVFSKTGTALLPPSKKLGFNKQLRQNDGVLLSWLQHALACDHTTALQHLEEFADYCNSILHNKRRLSIERLGFFYLDFENNLCFEPRTDVNFLSDSFGLAPVHLKEIELATPQGADPKPNLFIDRPASLPPQVPAEAAKSHYVNRAKKGLAFGALTVFMVLALSYIITSVGVQGPLKAAFYNKSAKAAYVSIEYPALSLSESKRNATALISTSEHEAILKLDENTRFVVSSGDNTKTGSELRTTHSRKANVITGHYRIVFGCFSVQSNAKKYAKRLEGKDYPVSITKLEDKEMYVVALDGYQTKAAAKAELGSLKTLFPHVWIKRVP